MASYCFFFCQSRSEGRGAWVSSSAGAAALVAAAKVKAATAEISTQTLEGEGVADASVQAGDGRLLSEEELSDKANCQELRVRGLGVDGRWGRRGRGGGGGGILVCCLP